MHMANELISLPVAAGTIAAAAGGLGWLCRKARSQLLSEKAALMGILGAFVFAAQMVNFQLPLMPGTSGHLIGAVFLSVVLGPALAAVVLSSVVIVQCLLFQDGGLLAIGCNIINIAIAPSFVGFAVYRLIAAKPDNKIRFYAGATAGSIASALAGSAIVVIEAKVSGVLLIPAGVFLTTMAGVHLIVGVMEGIITIAVLGYLRSVRPDLIEGLSANGAIFSRRTALAGIAALTVITGMGLSLLASDKPDGLEWSYAQRPDQPGFKPVVENPDSRIHKADEIHSKIALMPDYSVRTASDEHPASAGWTSLAGVAGSMVCMGLIWLSARLLRHSIKEAEH